MTLPIEELVGRYGSPLYVYQLQALDRSATQLLQSLPQGTGLHYSLKANPHPALACRLRSSGCRAEISSAGELAAALAAGYAAQECLYTGPAKTAAEIGSAVERGVEMFSVESLADYRRVSDAADEAGASVRCIARVNGGAVAASALRMSGPNTQFGFSLEELLTRSLLAVERPSGRIVGFHFFASSNVRSEDGLIAQAELAVAVASRLRSVGYRVEVLDLGGGFAAPYAEPGERAIYPRLRNRIEAALDTRFPEWRVGMPLVIFESGRYLVGGCGSLIATVMEVKQGGDGGYLLLDSGINHLGGLSGLGRMAMMRGARPEIGRDADESRMATLAGPLCTPADVLGRGVPIGLLTGGDHVVIPNVGAYGLTASLVAFLGRPAPAEVVVDGNRVVSVSRLEVVRTASAPTRAEVDGVPTS